MVCWKILAGGYDTFIATYLLTITAGTVDLSLLSKSQTGRDPSWITPHPTNRSLLYTVNELWPTGAVQTYSIAKNGSLSAPLDTISSLGAHPAHVVALPNGKVVVTNYNGGNARVIETSPDGTKFVNASSTAINFVIPAGSVSHPHQAVPHEEALLIPDLGADTIWRVKQEADGKYAFKEPIPQPKGSGPRHIAIADDRLFTLHELSSTLSAQPLPGLDSTSNHISRVSITPTDAPAASRWSAAEILIPPPSKAFPKQYIYVSNRNLGTVDSRGDTIAIFELVNKGTADEALVLVKQVHTGLHRIRGMEFGPAAGGGDKYLVASGSEGVGGVAILRRVDGGRNLEVVARNLEVPTRTSFIWL